MKEESDAVTNGEFLQGRMMEYGKISYIQVETINKCLFSFIVVLISLNISDCNEMAVDKALLKKSKRQHFKICTLFLQSLRYLRYIYCPTISLRILFIIFDS